MTKRLPKPSRKLLSVGLAVLALIAVGSGLLLVHKTKPAPDTQHKKAVTYSVSAPSETPVEPTYSVEPDKPLSIEFSGQDIKGFIQKVDIDQNKAIAAPNNIGLAGWFTGSALPGQRGLSIIDGHVDGVSQPGIFHNLAKVRQGDTVIVTYGDNTTKSFTVFETHSVETNQANDYLFSQDPMVVSQLNIITCTGRYDRSTQAYDQRFIVSAKLNM